MYKQLTDIKAKLDSLRVKGFERGKSIGWSFESLPYTVKRGCTTYVASSPASGKTELIKEIQINLSCLHGWNHVVFTPETGTTEEVFAEYCHSFVGKSYLKGNNEMNEAERTYAEMFIDEHFIIVDPVDEDLTIDQFYAMISDICNDWGKEVHTTVLDPWNELQEVYIPEDLGREDKYVSRVLGMVRKNARKTMRHHFIVTHVRDQAMVKQGEVSYFPMPHAREFAGGQSWFRKALTMLIPWRPPKGLSDENGIPYADNELHLKVAKSKPKGVGITGTYKLFLDTQRYQYYMIINEQKVYADRGEYSHNKQPEIFTPKQTDLVELGEKKIDKDSWDQLMYKTSEDENLPF